MSDEKQTNQIFENLLFPKVFRSFRMAIQPTKLIVALLALAVICLAGWIMDFSGNVVVTGKGVTELDSYIKNPIGLRRFVEVYKETGQRTGVFSTLWHFGSDKFHGALLSLFKFDLPGVAVNIGDCFRAIIWAFRYHYIYSIILFVITLTLLSVAGGAICRIAALQFARDEKPGLTESLRFGLKKFLSFFTAPLLPLAIIAFAALCIFLLGLIANIPRVGEIIMVILMPLALLAGSMVAVLLIGVVAGFNLMFPAVAYDGSDSFDAISRAISYVYSRPWRMTLYTVVAILYGAVCYIFVRFLVFLLLIATYGFLALGVFNNAEGADKLTRIWAKPTFVNFVPPNPEATSNGTEQYRFGGHLYILRRKRT